MSNVQPSYLSPLPADPELIADLAPKFSEGSWHLSVRPLRLTHYPILLNIAEQVAQKWPSLTFVAAVEQWANNGKSYWPHLHLVIQCDLEQAQGIERECAELDVKVVPVDGTQHAQHLLGRYLFKSETPMFQFRRGVEHLPVFTHEVPECQPVNARAWGIRSIVALIGGWIYKWLINRKIQIEEQQVRFLFLRGP